jgi:hypothetical protein
MKKYIKTIKKLVNRNIAGYTLLIISAIPGVFCYMALATEKYPYAWSALGVVVPQLLLILWDILVNCLQEND